MNAIYETGMCILPQPQEGQTALMKSSLRGRLDVVQELVRRGAFIDLKCKVCMYMYVYAM